MVSLQSALVLPEANMKRPPRLNSLVDGGNDDATATSKKRKRHDIDIDIDVDGEVEEEVEDGIELSFDAAPLPLEWQRCLDIKSGEIHYYNTRTQRRTSKDPRRQPESAAAYRASAPTLEDVEAVNRPAPAGLNLDLNLTFEPRRRAPPVQQKKAKQQPDVEAPKPAVADVVEVPAGESGAGEMFAAVCMRCHMLVMMSRASPACPNCKFVHPTSRGGAGAGAAPPQEPARIKLGLQLLCCRD